MRQGRRADILRRGRILAGVSLWIAATYALVSYAMTVPELAERIAKVQFMNAAMLFSISTIALWLIATLVFGRIYCSVACPLGVFQDICARLTRLGRRGRRREYHYRPPLTRCRNITLAIVIVAIFLGVTAVSDLLNPWTIYARACDYVVKPLWGIVLNAFADPPVRIALASAAGIVVAVLSVVVVGVLAGWDGRIYCNTICPVGTTLGFVARYSIFHIDINTDKCIQCRKCEHVCKSSCIDLTSHVVDSSRCVDCFDCLPVCPNDAIHYTWARHQLSLPMMMNVTRLAPGAQLAGGGRECECSDTAGLTENAKTSKDHKICDNISTCSTES
ncbi:MAG: 4Fe-4S binding protein [Duncaniella sp.]|nr:4Fe-4S binding protein [Duncaniella sp.]MDE6065943.1 4Fe-4S binding protein [Duncaniella sp.]